MITNASLSNQEIDWLDFFVANINDQKDTILSQINAAIIKSEYVKKEELLYFISFDFEYDKNLRVVMLEDYAFVTSLQVWHSNKAGPTMFELVVRDGLIETIEIYNADLSALVENEVCVGRLVLECVRLGDLH